jgi:hypothetical protein
MTLGRTPTGAIKIKTDGGLRAVECACCGGCECDSAQPIPPPEEPNFIPKLKGTDPNPFTILTIQAFGYTFSADWIIDPCTHSFDPKPSISYAANYSMVEGGLSLTNEYADFGCGSWEGFYAGEIDESQYDFIFKISLLEGSCLSVLFFHEDIFGGAYGQLNATLNADCGNFYGQPVKNKLLINNVSDYFAYGTSMESGVPPQMTLVFS